MSSPNPYPQAEDELDRLVQKALKALVCEQDPPERVWKRIKAHLEQGKSSPSRFEISWFPLVIQPALPLALIVLGTIGLQITSTPHDMRVPSSRGPSPSVATAYVEEDLTPLATAMPQDKTELRLAKTLSNPSFESSPSRRQALVITRLDASAGELAAKELVRAGIQLPKRGPADQSPLAVPRDPSPNVLSPTGRALIAELSLERRIVEDRIRRHSGPYQWSR
jgi:hypothetical protein